MGTQSAPSMSKQQGEFDALLNGPAGTPPADTKPNFDDPASLDTIIYITKTITLTLTTLAVFIRIYTRRFLLRSVGYDDYTCIIAWLGLIGYLTLSLLTMKAGAGIHMWDLRLSRFFGLLHWVNIVMIFYNPVNVFIKVSILLQYSRVFNPTGRTDLPVFIAIQLCIWSIVLFYSVLMFFSIFECNPRENIWNKLATTGYCYSINGINEASGIFNVVSDFAILVLPMPVIRRLQITFKKKLLILGIFAIGFSACLMSIMRTYYIWQIPESPDTSYQFGVFGLWSDAELSVGIIIGCFPVMPKFFQHVRPKVYEAFSFRPKPTDALGQDPERRSKTPRAGTLIQNKNPFAKYKAGPSILETRDDPYTQPHGEYYTLNESKPSQRQGATTFDPIRGSFPGTSTRREDLEYGHYNPEVVGERSSRKNAH